ncbi:MAG: PhzF family phenazine biosynthesis protein [Gammaproteobacteria bacterium]|nr:PhzF family phenazine biosynthesis protein [Gammaproteobacteria bacterium]
MKQRSLALYDAFSERAFGGSQAAILRDASGLSRATRTRIAREVGMPATAFVDTLGDDWIQAQFMSTVMELPMCGHGTLCLLTHLCETGDLAVEPGNTREFELRLPKNTARVEVSLRADGRYRVMLDITPSTLAAFAPDPGPLLRALGIDSSSLDPTLPLEVARGDFVHLAVPLAGLGAMRAIEPDFDAIVDFCHAHGLETIALFCREVERPASTIHVRDFCPAVGVAESAAAGTTNAALTAYLWRHSLIDRRRELIVIEAEQGIELGRPSSIQSVIRQRAGAIDRLQVGGIATRVIDGHIELPD